MPQATKYPHQRQLDFLYAHKGIGLKNLGEEITEEAMEWQRVWIERGKPNDHPKLSIWSNEVVQMIDEHLSEFEDEILEDLQESNTLVAPTPTADVAVETPSKPATPIVAKTTLKERISPLEQALEKLYQAGQLSVTKRQLQEAGFDPGIFGWSSKGWNKGKKYALKKAKRDKVYTIEKV